jgi:hypothetical protein
VSVGGRVSVDLEQPAAWLRRPREPARSHHAFGHYDALGPGARSLRRAYAEHKLRCDHITVSESRRAPGRWAAWSITWDWQTRVRLHDEALEAIKLQKIADVVAAASERHARVLQAAVSVASVLPRVILECLQNPEALPQLIATAKGSPAALLRLLEASRPFLAVIPSLIESERLVHGLPTQDVVVEDKRKADLAFSEALIASPAAVTHLIAALDCVAGSGPGTAAADLKGQLR